MFCKHCGADMGNGKFCPSCGKPADSIVETVTSTAEHVFEKTEDELKNAIHDVAGTSNQNSGSYSEGNTSGSYNAGPNGGYGGNEQTPPPSAGALKTDRSLLTYILLNIITCGIYGYYFIYKIAADVNEACAGDGNTTGGLVQFILLSIITCGIYSWFWYYNLGNRLAENAPRYSMNFQENGTTVLLWLIFGSLICGIGPYVAMYILIKNTNAICVAYNNKNGFYNFQ